VTAAGTSDFAALAELSQRLSRCPDLDTLLNVALGALDELFGYEHAVIMLLDDDGQRLYTIASHGYDTQGIGSELRLGEGAIGMAAARVAPMRISNLRQMLKYSRSARRSYEQEGGAPAAEIPLPGLADAQSQLAVPAVALGQLVGVLGVESRAMLAFSESDQDRLTVVATLLANAIEIDLAQERSATPADAVAGGIAVDADGPRTHVRFFPVDGSVFVDDDYLIRGVAGRILWLLLREYCADGRVEFTNRELRLDPSLELPEFRDNLDSRLVLLKRRLDERDAPFRIEKTGRGRFRLAVERTPVLVDA